MNNLELFKSELADCFASHGLNQDHIVLFRPSNLPDQALIYIIGNHNSKAVLHFSPTSFPNTVAEGLKKAELMRECLDPELGAVILEPLAQGCINGTSYALLPFCKNFSRYKFIWKCQSILIKSSVLEWLHKITLKHHTEATSAVERICFSSALEFLSEISNIDKDVKKAALTALVRLNSNKFKPYFVPMHNDLWKENFLQLKNVKGKKPQYPFVVIDWQGSLIKGFPVYDLIRVSLSFRLSDKELRSELVRISSVLECDISDLRSYLLIALGDIAKRLNHFPLESFQGLASSCLHEIKKAGI